MSWRKVFWRLFFTVWILGSVTITLMVIHTLRIPLNPVQRISYEGEPRPSIPDCSDAPSNELSPGTATIDDFLNRPREPVTGSADLPSRDHGEGCVREREEALAEWRKDSVLAYRTPIFWYRAAFLLAATAVWSVLVWGLFYLGVRVAAGVNKRRGAFPVAGYDSDRQAASDVVPYILNPVKFDPDYGPIPIPGIGPPSNLVRLTWAEMKRVSDAFRELDIPGPGICLSCRKKGVNDMHPIEDMYALMDGAKSDAMAGLSRKRSPFFVGTCRTCAPEIHETP